LKCVAVFGGSFNPVHNGHLLAAREVLEKTEADEIWFMPCRVHAFKSRRKFAPEKHRVEMLKRAVKGEKGMKVSLLEIKLGKRRRKESRTLDTVRELRRKYPRFAFLWMIGSNLVGEVPEWEGFSDLVKEVRIVVVPVEGFTRRSILSAKWLEENNAIVLPKRGAVENISSTQVRERISSGKSVSALVPGAVWKYIEENLLFVPSEFNRVVYAAVKKIPRGRISTYSEIARAVGRKKAARAVGNALNRNPFFPVVPCHRVVRANAETGGFGRGEAEKEKLLKSEGLRVKNGRILDFGKKLMKASDLV